MHDYLKNSDINIKNGADINSVMRDMMSILLEGSLDEEPGYSRYDYRNRVTDNNRNDHSKKIIHTSYRDKDIAIPGYHNGKYEPKLIKKYQNTLTQDMHGGKNLSMHVKA